MERADMEKPMPVLPTRVRRTYMGGSMIDAWRGEEIQPDGNMPEEWLASTTLAINPGFAPIEDEGHSRVELGDSKPILRDILDVAPEAMLGRKHAEKYGSALGMLAKMIDAGERLSIQVHPDKAFVQKHFHSPFGKTECWHIIETRCVNGNKPYLLIGFRPGVTKEYWSRLYETQDIAAMMSCLHKIEPKPGETYFIPGGLPHAIGPGCFLLEIQEPTDYTMRCERTTQDGRNIPDRLVHQMLGDELLMECFRYEGLEEELFLKQCRLSPVVTHQSDVGRNLLLVGEQITKCFSMMLASCIVELSFRPTAPSVLVVLRGNGALVHDGRFYALRQGDHIFLPIGVREFSLVNKNAIGSLECMRCFPPEAQPDSPIL
ncbi:MAG: class I mannose-6-phosphate isomerase [Clostridiales bacterium]|jgi:mannose-6-phosphate isomerase|nr:class I mannose-6-phosphate isomerase [Clostridiales bacterium]